MVQKVTYQPMHCPSCNSPEGLRKKLGPYGRQVFSNEPERAKCPNHSAETPVYLVPSE